MRREKECLKDYKKTFKLCWRRCTLLRWTYVSNRIILLQNSYQHRVVCRTMTTSAEYLNGHPFLLSLIWWRTYGLKWDVAVWVLSRPATSLHESQNKLFLLRCTKEERENVRTIFKKFGDQTERRPSEDLTAHASRNTRWDQKVSGLSKFIEKKYIFWSYIWPKLRLK